MVFNVIGLIYWRLTLQASPLRFDKLSDVKFKNSKAAGKPPLPTPTPTSTTVTNGTSDSRPNFLFTLGPRPFWELWPLKRSKKKHLTAIEFRACLLDRWAKTRTVTGTTFQRNLTGTGSAFQQNSAGNGNTFSSSSFMQPRSHRRVRSTRWVQ